MKVHVERLPQLKLVESEIKIDTTGVEDKPVVDISYVEQNKQQLTGLITYSGMVCGISVEILIDTGASESIISKQFVEKNNTMFTLQPSEMVVSTADGTKVNTNMKVCNAPIKINGYFDRIDMQVMKLHRYDVILGRPWLESNLVQIDFPGKICRITCKRVKNVWDHQTRCYRKHEYNVNIKLQREGYDQSHELISKHQLREMMHDNKIDAIYVVSAVTSKGQCDERGHYDIKSVTACNDSGLDMNRLTSGQCSTSGHDIDRLTSGDGTDSGLDQSDRLTSGYRDVSVHLVVKQVVLGTSSESEHPVGKQLMREFEDVCNQPQGLPPVRDVECHIELKDSNAVPPAQHPRPLAPELQRELKQDLDKDLAAGRIRPSKSPYSSPVIYVKKKDGTWRRCHDYRALNLLTKRNNYPLPRISELLDQLSGAKWFSKIDLNGAFHQVRMAEDSIEKTAFTTRYGSFEFLVMPFGLTNAPAVFMSLMNTELHDMLDKFVIVYIDDILVYSKTEQEHEQHLRQLFIRLRERKLYAKPSKCELFKQSIPFLGHIISGDGISMDPEKVKAITEWPVPKTVEDVQRFLGLAGYYRKFIQDYATLTACLYDLTHQDAVWKWTDTCNDTFNDLKHMISEPKYGVLAIADGSKPFIVKTDASGFAIAGELSQIGTDGEPHPIAFYSKKMNSAERNYPVHEQELLAVIQCLREWRHYLEGQPDTQVHTDHRSLEHLFRQKELSRRQARWIELIQTILPSIQYIKGVDNKVADAISRRADLKENDSVEYMDVDMIDINAVSVVSIGEELRHDIIEAYADDPETTAILNYSTEELQKDNKFYIIDGLICTHRDTVYIPNVTRLKQAILKIYHDTMDHRGIIKTTEYISRLFYWPKLNADITDYVTSCSTCAQTKYRTQLLPGLMHPLPIPTRPWQHISMDFMGPLPVSGAQRYNMIFVVIDRYSKFAVFVPCNTNDTAEHIAKLFSDHVYQLSGVPSIIVSDRDTKFDSKFWRALWTRLGTELRMTTAYHQQANGAAERLIKTLNELIRIGTNSEHNNWADQLKLYQARYNATMHESTKQSPYFVLFGQQFQEPSQLIDVPQQDADTVLNQWKIAIESMETKLQEAAAKQKLYYDKHRVDVQYNVNDLVYITAENLIDVNNISAKQRWCYTGPFKIIAKLDNDNYKLQLKSGMIARGISDEFHVSKLRQYRVSDQFEREVALAPEPIDINGDWEYIVEKIVNHKCDKNNRISKYFVKWQGYDDTHNSWEPPSNLVNAKSLIDAYNSTVKIDRAMAQLDQVRRSRRVAKRNTAIAFLNAAAKKAAGGKRRSYNRIPRITVDELSDVESVPNKYDIQNAEVDMLGLCMYLQCRT